MARAPYIDFAELKKCVSIQMVVQEHYNIDLTQKNGQFVGNCILCSNDDDESERFKITPDLGETGGWKCHNPECVSNTSNKARKKNVLELVAQVEDISVPKAGQVIAEWFNITDCNYKKSRNSKSKQNGTSSANGSSDSAPTPEDPSGSVHEGSAEENREPAQRSAAEIPTPAPATATDYGEEESPDASILRHNPPLEWGGLKNLDATCESLSEAYIWLPEIAENFEAGLCSRGMMKGRFAVPIHNLDGGLLAYCGIGFTGDEEDRLKFPPADKYDPSIDLFNLHRAIGDKKFKENGQLTIVEDITELFQVWDKGNKNVVATMQGTPTDQQILRLKSLDTPRMAISVLWRQPSAELATTLSKLAEFAWVRVRYATGNI